MKYCSYLGTNKGIKKLNWRFMIMKHSHIHGILDIPDYIHSQQFSSQPPDGHLLVEITLSSHEVNLKHCGSVLYPILIVQHKKNKTQSGFVSHSFCK